VFIYRISNLVNGKVYIGKWQGSRVETRWQEHKKAAESGSVVCPHFYSAIRKYGWSSFKLEIIHQTSDKEELSAMEIFFIVLHQSHKPENGYNMTLGGEGFSPREETRRKIALGQMGRSPSQETRKKLGLAKKGQKHSEETKRTISSKLKGIKRSEETRRKVSEARRRRAA
jgi:group I intron endonuclease